ncbi:cell filamentation protein Fic [Candidatus Micrarchaeota archaeon CG09_land_8_20_14_0_10_60_16]|nr:MAG: cell filamentation protein Fic [Candidatus Micrarchaeota archaeon CG09_land_8_20_14_0_10_60_16]
MITEPLAGRILEKRRRLDALRPIPKAALEKLRERFELEWTYNSNAIEGNTLTLRETMLVLKEGVTIGGKSLREHLEVTNHKAAIDFVYGLLGKKRVSERDVLEIHALILDRIDAPNAGFYRRERVRISGSEYTPPSPEKVPSLMREFAETFKKEPEQPLAAIEFSAAAHFALVHIHPFVDGNGRTARLLTNLFLMRHGFPPAVILKTDRPRYYSALEAGHKGDAQPFVELVARSVERSLDLYLEVLEKPSQKTDLVSLAEAAKLTPYSQEYLSLLARKGRLPALKRGRSWVTSGKDVEAYLASVGKRGKKA